MCGAPAVLALLRLCGERGCVECKVLPKGPLAGYLAFELNQRIFGQGAAPGSEHMAELLSAQHRDSLHATSLRHCKSFEECVLNAGFIFTQQNKLTGIN